MIQVVLGGRLIDVTRSSRPGVQAAAVRVRGVPAPGDPSFLAPWQGPSLPPGCQHPPGTPWRWDPCPPPPAISSSDLGALLALV